MNISFKNLALACVVAVTSAISADAKSPGNLRFNPNQYTTSSLTMPDGSNVAFKVYEGIYYVSNVEDSTYQTLNIYVPERMANVEQVPIFLRTYVGGYMASTAKTPSATDATGRALQEGYVVCIPGARGSNSVVEKKGKKVYTGVAPNGVLDLKAAVRYLRFNDDLIPGSSELIFTDGTSAGGAMSSLLGATGNAVEYEPYLRKMGAADACDDIFAAICYCPITDLNHADMEYEWLYGCTNSGVRHLSDAQIQISNELSALCPDYINSLSLRKKDGTLLTSGNYRDYIKEFLIASAQRALQEGCVIPDTIGFTFYQEEPPVIMMGRNGGKGGIHRGGANDGRQAPSFGPGNRSAFNRNTDFVKDLDLDKYLNFVATQQALKTPPAFDQLGVLIDIPSVENSVFGNAEGVPANFTEFSLRHRLHDPNACLTEDMVKRVYLMNPMNFIGTGKSKVAPNWYIRHGAKDRDTSFLVPINLATKLENNGMNVDFFLPWNRSHSGDYNLDDLFRWIDGLVKPKCP